MTEEEFAEQERRIEEEMVKQERERYDKEARKAMYDALGERPPWYELAWRPWGFIIVGGIVLLILLALLGFRAMDRSTTSPRLLPAPIAADDSGIQACGIIAKRVEKSEEVIQSQDQAKGFEDLFARSNAEDIKAAGNGYLRASKTAVEIAPILQAFEELRTACANHNVTIDSPLSGFGGN